MLNGFFLKMIDTHQNFPPYFSGKKHYINHQICTAGINMSIAMQNMTYCLRKSRLTMSKHSKKFSMRKVKLIILRLYIWVQIIHFYQKEVSLRKFLKDFKF